MSILEVCDLSIGYGKQRIVRNISFTLKKGEILAIVGESGSGKSTLLRALIGKTPSGGQVNKGEILYENQDLSSLNQSQLRKIRGKSISMIFQSPGGTLNPVRKIGSQFIEAIRTHMEITKADAYHKALEILTKLHFKNATQIMEAYPFQLSGGMKQRVAIALALALEPEILLADEPTSALDATVQKKVIDEMLELREHFNTAIIIVTHNICLASYIADKVGVMYLGQFLEFGTAEEILLSPQHPYTRALLDSVPVLSQKKTLTGIEGRRYGFHELPSGCSFSNRCKEGGVRCKDLVPPKTVNDRGHMCICNQLMNHRQDRNGKK